MTEKEIKAVVTGFVARLLDERDKNTNFDFFLFFDIDSPDQNHTGVDVMFTNTFSSMEGYREGMVMIDVAMRDRMSRGGDGFASDRDVMNNTTLRLLGHDGYLTN